MDHSFRVKQKKDDDRLDDDAPPNFVYHIEDSKPGDLMPGIKSIEQGKSIVMPNGALGIADDHKVQENRYGITAKYGELPSLPEYDGLQNGDSTISKLMKNFMGKHTGDSEFKNINRKNDLMLQRLVDDKPEDRYRQKPHVYVDPKDDVKLDDTFLGSDADGTFNDRSEYNLPLPSERQNFDVVNKWESTLEKLTQGKGRDDGIRESEYPLKPFPFDQLH